MAGSSIYKLVRKPPAHALTRVCVVGVGDTGIQVIEQLLGGDVAGATVAVVHTNAQALATSQAQTRVQIGRGGETEGGCGGMHERGRKAAERDVEMLRGLLSDCELLILVGGLGGGTAGGAMPVLARLARETGIISVALVTQPFAFEGEQRQRAAEDALKTLTVVTDFTAVISGDDWVVQADNVPMDAAFAEAHAALAAAVFSVWHVLAKSPVLGLDVGDLRSLAALGTGYCRFAFGMATGATRAEDARQALLAGRAGSRERLAAGAGVLACVCASRDLRMEEVATVLAPLQEIVPETGFLRAGVVLNDAWRSRFFLAVFFVDAKRRVSVTVRQVRKGETVKGKSAQPRAAQEELNLDGTKDSGGRFVNIKATILDGEDLDVPTFIRRGIKLER